jgi:hypothetical protein
MKSLRLCSYKSTHKMTVRVFSIFNVIKVAGTLIRFSELNNNNSVQFNSLFLFAESTATRPITDTAQCR